MKRKSYWLQRSFTPNQMVDTLIAACQWDLGACGGDGPKETLYPPCRLKLKKEKKGKILVINPVQQKHISGYRADGSSQPHGQIRQPTRQSQTTSGRRKRPLEPNSIKAYQTPILLNLMRFDIKSQWRDCAELRDQPCLQVSAVHDVTLDPPENLGS